MNQERDLQTEGAFSDNVLTLNKADGTGVDIPLPESGVTDINYILDVKNSKTVIDNRSSLSTDSTSESVTVLSFNEGVYGKSIIGDIVKKYRDNLFRYNATTISEQIEAKCKLTVNSGDTIPITNINGTVPRFYKSINGVRTEITKFRMTNLYCYFGSGNYINKPTKLHSIDIDITNETIGFPDSDNVFYWTEDTYPRDFTAYLTENSEIIELE